MAQDLAATGVELPALMTAGQWKSSGMPASYTECQAADRGVVARYYQDDRRVRVQLGGPERPVLRTFRWEIQI